MGMKEVASPTYADVIVFVNNTQLDAADQPRLPKAPPRTQRAGTPSAFQPYHPDRSAVSSASSERRSCSVDASAITHHPIIHHKHRHATHTFCTHGHIILVRPFFAASLTSQMKIHTGINPWSACCCCCCLSVTFLPTLRHRESEINNNREAALPVMSYREARDAPTEPIHTRSAPGSKIRIGQT